MAPPTCAGSAITQAGRYMTAREAKKTDCKEIHRAPTLLCLTTTSLNASREGYARRDLPAVDSELGEPALEASV